MTERQPALDIRNLRFRYPGAPQWLIDLPALSLNPGEQMLLTGGSGSGKSTLLLLIAGLVDPDEGSITVDARPIHALRGAERDLFRGRRIGMIFQTFNLLPGFSALENVMAALMFSDAPPATHRSRAEAVLARLGIEDIHRDPDRLSVGQQQRVAVARALVCDPVLVLADEPTASLDPENALSSMTLIQDACREKGASLLCVSHDPSMAGRFERRQSLHTINTPAA